MRRLRIWLVALLWLSCSLLLFCLDPVLGIIWAMCWPFVLELMHGN